jgi:hypothetical protein
MGFYRNSITRDSLLVGVSSLCVAAVVAWLNWDHDLQSSIYRGHYLGLARFMRGEADFQMFTYPIWGYPAVLALTHYTDFWTITLQCILASLVLALLYRSSSACLHSRKILFVLCMFAVPWFSLASAKVADIWSAGFGVLAILSLSEMFEKRSTGYAVLAGVLFGVACNFRSDYLAFVFGLPLGVAVLAPRYLKPHAKHFVLIIILVPLSVVPWGLYRMAHGAPFGITSSNGGMAMVNSLGFQGNRWGISRHDAKRRAEVREALGPDVLPWSVEGNAFFQARFRQAVTEQPLEFVRKVWSNLTTTLKYGFYTMEVEPYLQPDDAVRFEVLKEQLKVLAGSQANASDIEKFREQGLWDEDFSPTHVPARLWAIASVSIVGSLVSGIFLVILLVALGRLVFFDRMRIREPLLLSCSLGVIYVWALIGLLQNEQRQANVLYVMGIPLVVDLVDRLRARKLESQKNDPI